MKKILMLMMSIAFIACNNPNPGESGTVDDGIKAVDSNGALEDSPQQFNPGVDTAIGDDRVDTEKRDSSRQ